MIRLLKFLFTGDWHLHKWTIIDQGTVGYCGRKTGNRYYCQCEHCGKIRDFE